MQSGVQQSRAAGQQQQCALFGRDPKSENVRAAVEDGKMIDTPFNSEREARLEGLSGAKCR